ncbi:MAG: hypothetical protein ACOYON_02730 [Fimbriimonas sp.]
MANFEAPILVKEFLSQAGSGVADLHRTLVEQSETDLGVLVVKDATFRVECAITTVKTSNGIAASVLPDFFLGLKGDNASSTNKITIDLKIVNVPALPKPETKPDVVEKPGLQNSEHDIIKRVIDMLADKLAKAKASSTTREMRKKLKALDVLLAADKFTEAGAGLQEFMRQYSREVTTLLNS